MTSNPNTILVIEDNPLNLKLVKSLLSIMGCSILEAENAEKGIALAKEHLPDLILMDIELPGMDGRSATRMIKEDPDLKRIKVIALTACAMENERKMAVDSGFDGYLTKPIDVNSFPQIIGKYLQRPDSPGIAPAEKKTVPAETYFGHRILIVDDEPLNVKLLSANLSAKGYQILSAYDGRTAIDLVYREKPALILLDIMMPGMNGYEVTRKLKSDPETQHIPIILITALDGEDDKEKGSQAGADEFLNKPVIYSELEARVNSLLRLREYKDALETRKAIERSVVEGNPDAPENPDFNEAPTVLIAEDDELAVKLLMQYLANFPCQIQRAGNGKEVIAATTREKVDIVLLDIMLPEMNGFEVCRKLKENEDTFPIQIVMMTSLKDLNSKLKGISVGTDDYLVKPIKKEELCTRITSLHKKKRYLDRLRKKIDVTLHAAIIDEFTGVYNKAYFNHFLKYEIKRSHRWRHPFSLLIIDVKDFKCFIDAHGHLASDHALRQIGKLLQQNLREIDLVARFRGEEFAVVMPYTDKMSAVNAADRLLFSIRKQNAVDPQNCSRVSIGIATFPEHGRSAEELIIAADAALCTAKSLEKNQIGLCQKLLQNTGFRPADTGAGSCY